MRGETTMMDTGLYEIAVEDIRFAGDPWQPDAAPLPSNPRLPVIVVEHPDHYRLIDGHGRVSGLRAAGAEYCHAILVSDEDLARCASGDDEAWIEEMWMKYVPTLTYRRGH
jgi:hypothetical protein